ncbi:hypothetical protein AJ80_06682 [Polytolypa hystricis UAMH7299]|uniref:Vacuolar membrane protein n=1 Tax=Polytolypa hystricis (strain UAMH7299) TaxID=1447883 RepID=A0A2B7XUS3_POLH7|nr:hypothetical protein AJ80_06682 [Polytolypa hystricis UAMH7299]
MGVDPSIVASVALAAVSILPTSTAIMVSSVPAATNGTATPQEAGDVGNGECQLLGPFAILVQAALGALALLSLVYKRYRERPQRPVKVWAFDVSKQVFGSGLLHLANLLAAMFSAGQIPVTATYQPNPCSYYLLNLGIDTTLGIPILILILRVLNYAARYTPLANPPESIESGNYGHPPNAKWWFKQSIIYFIGLLGMKTCAFFIIHLVPFVVKIGDWALRWTEGNTAIQIFFVMLLFPLIMNAIQYYIIDIFIKKPISENEQMDDDDFEAGLMGDDRHHRSALLAGLDDDGDTSDDESLILSDDEAIAKESFDARSIKSNNHTSSSE